MKTIMLLLVASLAATAAQSCFAQAEDCRKAIEVIAMSPTQISISALEARVVSKAVDRANVEKQLKRLQEDWSRFVREKTTEEKSGRYRQLEAAVFWKEFFGSMPDDMAWVLASRAHYISRLQGYLENAKTHVEMEADPELRSKMIGRIEVAMKDIETWQKRDHNSRSARNRLSQSIPALIAPFTPKAPGAAPAEAEASK